MNAIDATRVDRAGVGYSLQGFSNSKVIKPPFSGYGNKIEALLSRLDKVKPNGNGKWQALCPAHPDKSPSLAIKLTDDGKILIHCFAGCSVVDIVSAVGLELSDLMPENLAYKKGTKPPKFNKYELFETLAFESLILSIAIRQLLNYEDLNQADLLRVIRAENTINSIVSEVRS
jgi:hypothetical protein